MSALPGNAADIIRFYRGEQADQSGRLLPEILGQCHEWLEFTHDYIQWLFPLTETSGFNPEAPVLTPATIAAFRGDPALGEQLQQAFKVMLAFYGLQLEPGGRGKLEVTKSSHFEQRARNWLAPGNHNHLRITRILQSLCLLGLRPQAEAFLACLLGIYRDHPQTISSRTVNFWRGTVT